MLYDPMVQPISEFIGRWRFLSNFYPHPTLLADEVNDAWYPTLEHAYQAAKTLDADQRKKVLAAKTPGDAKRLGRRVLLRPDWEQIKLDVMRDLLRNKFCSSKIMREMMATTGNAQLIEGNYWGDTFWGECAGEGENHLGKLLMQIRQEIREEAGP